MIVVEFVFALIVSMICAALLLPFAARSRLRSRYPRLEPVSIFVILLILFLATWAGGIWLVPFGPRLWGVAWASFVVVGLVVALLMAALSDVEDTAIMPGYAVRVRPRVVNLLSLTLLVLLILAIIAGYAHQR